MFGAFFYTYSMKYFFFILILFLHFLSIAQNDSLQLEDSLSKKKYFFLLSDTISDIEIHKKLPFTFQRWMMFRQEMTLSGL